MKCWPPSKNFGISSYSERRELVGFAMAALMDRYPTVSNAIATVVANAIKNTEGPTLILYAN